MKFFQRTTSQLQRGFTLLEVLLVVAIIAILAGIVIIAINPSKNLADTRNSTRRADVNTIINAVYQWSLDQSGALPPAGGGGAVAISTTDTEICQTGGDCTGLVDLSVLTDTGTYLVAMPLDPSCPTQCAAEGIGYTIAKDANNRLIVKAPDAEGETIQVTR